MAWGGGKPPWPPPPWEIRSPRAGAPPRGLYKGGQGRGAAHPMPWRLPLPLQHILLLHKCTAKPCRSTAVPPSPRRRAAAGAFFPNLSFALLDQQGGDVTLSVRVLNAEVLSVRH